MPPWDGIDRSQFRDVHVPNTLVTNDEALERYPTRAGLFSASTVDWGSNFGSRGPCVTNVNEPMAPLFNGTDLLARAIDEDFLNHHSMNGCDATLMGSGVS